MDQEGMDILEVLNPREESREHKPASLTCRSELGTRRLFLVARSSFPGNRRRELGTSSFNVPDHSQERDT